MGEVAKKRVLVIGGGSIGERHIRCFQRSGRADVALCEINASVCQRVADTYSLCDVFTDFDSAVASRPEIAVICTPAHLHVPMAGRVCDIGAHLLVEKPLSVSTDGVDKLISAVRERSLTAAVAYTYRAHPALVEMKRAIDEGRFGRPVHVVVVSGQHFPHYRPAYRETYYTDRATGGGAIQDGLTHLVNAVEWLVGPTTRVVADAEHAMLDGVDMEDTVNVIARHADVMTVYGFNQHQAPTETSLTVVCERGTARYEVNGQRWMSATDPGKDWSVEAEFPFERDDAFVRQANTFLDAVEGRATPVCSFEEGAQTLRAILAILKSTEIGAWAAID